MHGVSVSEMYLLYTAVKLVRLADAQWHLNLAIMMTNGIPEISRLFLEPFFLSSSHKDIALSCWNQPPLPGNMMIIKDASTFLKGRIYFQFVSNYLYRLSHL